MKISVRRYQSHCKRLCLASERAHTQGLKGAGYSYSLACASTIFFLFFFIKRLNCPLPHLIKQENHNKKKKTKKPIAQVIDSLLLIIIQLFYFAFKKPKIPLTNN